VSVTSIRGVVAEYSAAILLATNGYDVHWPMDPISTYDLLVGKNEKYRKIQVKRAYWNSRGSLAVSTRAGRGLPYQPGDFDMLLAMAEDGRAWLIPYPACHNRKCLYLDTKTPTTRGRKKAYDPDLWLLIKPETTSEQG
jgi:hypothetical protein